MTCDRCEDTGTIGPEEPCPCLAVLAETRAVLALVVDEEECFDPACLGVATSRRRVDRVSVGFCPDHSERWLRMWAARRAEA